MKGLTVDATLSELVSHLSAPEKVVRDKSRKLVKPWMQRRKASLTFKDYMHIWKALSYDVWLADKTAVIRDVSIDICKLTRPSLALVNQDRQSAFLAAFIATLQNDWDNLDRWRVEKFQTLVRILITDLIYQMINSQWNCKIVEGIMTALIVTNPNLWLRDLEEKTSKVETTRKSRKRARKETETPSAKETETPSATETSAETETETPSLKRKSKRDQGKEGIAKSGETAESGETAKVEVDVIESGKDLLKLVREFQRPQAPRGCALQIMQSWSEEWKRQLGGDKKLSIGTGDNAVSIQTLALILTFPTKILTSKLSDGASVDAVYKGILKPMVDLVDEVSRPVLLRVLGSLLFKICASKTIRKNARELGLEMIAAIDQDLDSMEVSGINYEKLSDELLDESFSESLAFLTPEKINSQGFC